MKGSVLEKRLAWAAVTAGSLAVAAPGLTLADRGGGDDSRSEFVGIVQKRPQSGLQGVWLIGGRTFVADTGTEFDQSEGALVVGGCAKVDLRDGRVHEIDSEPTGDCR